MTSRGPFKDLRFITLGLLLVGMIIGVGASDPRPLSAQPLTRLPKSPSLPLGTQPNILPLTSTPRLQVAPAVQAPLILNQLTELRRRLNSRGDQCVIDKRQAEIDRLQAKAQAAQAQATAKLQNQLQQESGKPSLYSRVKGFFGGIFSKAPTTTTIDTSKISPAPTALGTKAGRGPATLTRQPLIVPTAVADPCKVDIDALTDQILRIVVGTPSDVAALPDVFHDEVEALLDVLGVRVNVWSPAFAVNADLSYVGNPNYPDDPQRAACLAGKAAFNYSSGLLNRLSDRDLRHLNSAFYDCEGRFSESDLWWRELEYFTIGTRLMERQLEGAPRAIVLSFYNHLLAPALAYSDLISSDFVSSPADARFGHPRRGSWTTYLLRIHDPNPSALPGARWTAGPGADAFSRPYLHETLAAAATAHNPFLYDPNGFGIPFMNWSVFMPQKSPLPASEVFNRLITLNGACNDFEMMGPDQCRSSSCPNVDMTDPAVAASLPGQCQERGPQGPNRGRVGGLGGVSGSSLADLLQGCLGPKVGGNGLSYTSSDGSTAGGGQCNLGGIRMSFNAGDIPGASGLCGGETAEGGTQPGLTAEQAAAERAEAEQQKAGPAGPPTTGTTTSTSFDATDGAITIETTNPDGSGTETTALPSGEIYATIYFADGSYNQTAYLGDAGTSTSKVDAAGNGVQMFFNSDGSISQMSEFYDEGDRQVFGPREHHRNESPFQYGRHVCDTDISNCASSSCDSFDQVIRAVSNCFGRTPSPPPPCSISTRDGCGEGSGTDESCGNRITVGLPAICEQVDCEGSVATVNFSGMDTAAAASTCCRASGGGSSPSEAGPLNLGPGRSHLGIGTSEPGGFNPDGTPLPGISGTPGGGIPPGSPPDTDQ